MRWNIITAAVMMLVLYSQAMADQSMSAGDLTIVVTGLKGTAGYVNISLADSEKSFLERDKSLCQIRMRPSGTEVAIVLKALPYGEYAASIFHDVNGNGTLDRNMLGIPKEPYGFSNNARGKFGPPQYSMSRFTMASEAQTIKVVLH